MTFRRHRKPTQPQPVLVPESHRGQSGYSVFEDGKRKAWGASESAAWAAFQVSRAA